MIAVVDTSVLVHSWREGGSDLDALTGAVIPLAVHAELLVGVQMARDGDAERRRLSRTYQLLQADVRRPTRETAQAWSALSLQLRRIGRKVPHNDVWVAAAAVELHLPLLTRDKHHAGLPGVTLVALSE